MHIEEKFKRVAELFREIEEEGFYGTLTFQFRKGIVQLVRKEETLTGSDVFPKTLKSISGKTAEESS